MKFPILQTQFHLFSSSGVAFKGVRRADYILQRPTEKLNAKPLVQNYYEFQDSNSKALNLMWSPPQGGALGD